ncbi:metal ABC transporter solute-binding protein, Zn/Mn family [Roseibacillus ishigakijimensis]|uniref:Zinc ABC transporter substrate-binding protein n=1 Tax=Roseibacillus ishigakijimensis TaxID=454146 RepID=A0A934RJQ7_9BACT|nr:zinc ABC transporter substrate-binding protein [Roseibacillus ishigakijimensis]MBK1832942.1 zinc ABC transporter substrate-binding protein [Roseibacillus ishigakijimensis]
MNSLFFRLLTSTGALVLLLGIASCRDKEGAKSVASSFSHPYRITATTGMIADITRQVVGGEEVAEVTNLIGEGIDPHAYKAARSDLLALQKADLVLYNGLLLEGKMGDTFSRLGESGKPVVAVAESVLQSTQGPLRDESDHPDPHVWMDVRLWMQAVETIATTLMKHDHAHADRYRENADRYLAELRQLDDYARTSLATIPQEQRVLVTAHDAFGYLARAYGIEVRGVQGLSTESEAGVRDIENLVLFLIDRKIPAIFVESSVSDQHVKALQEGARAQGHEVTIGGKLFSDAMGPAGTYEGTYVGMIDHNITTITRALGGQARGFRASRN